MLKICETPEISRPRERLNSVGPSALSDHELIAILLGSGTKERDVLQISSEILRCIDSEGEGVSIECLRKIKGVGQAKACIVLAALEFSRRRIRPHGVKIRESKDILPLISHLNDRQQEHFICISLNGAHEVIATRIVTIGLVNSSQVHPREVFSDPLKDRACAVIVCHNHPSGNLEPSNEDKKVTNLLKAAGEVLGVKLLDHVIFNFNGFYSFADRGML